MATVKSVRSPVALPDVADARGARFPRLWHFAAEYLLLLPLGAVIALVWANTLPESYFDTAFRLEFLVNDVAMVLFFGLIMKEVAEATAPGGVLHPRRRALLRSCSPPSRRTSVSLASSKAGRPSSSATSRSDTSLPSSSSASIR
jgi:hypothetical protein